MRKATFYASATLGGLGALFFFFVLWTMFFGGGGGGSKIARVDCDFASIGRAIKMYGVNAGQPPTTAQGMIALVREPMTGPKPERWSQMLERTPLDPWNIPYHYQLLPPTGPRWRFELRCAGPDGFFGSGDDLAEEFQAGLIFHQVAEDGGEQLNPRSTY